MANDVDVKFGADIAELKDKLDQVGGLFKRFSEQFAALTAIVAGGTAFKKFIDETIALNAEAMKLSKMLGVTGEEAGNLNTLLGDIGSNAETYTGAFLHFNRSLRQNADEMKSMGVDINALRNGQKSSNEVFVEALTIFGRYKPGIDQTQAAMKLFGRSVEDVHKLQRLANEVTGETAKRLGKSREELNATLTPLQKYNANMETAAEKNKALHLTITAEGLAATREYKEAMNDVGDVMAGVSKTIGEAVIPHFTDLARQLADMGPTIVEGVGAAIQIMITLWDELGSMVAAVWDGIKSILISLGELFGLTFGKDGPGAMEIFKNAIRVVQIAIIAFSTGFKEMVSIITTGLQLTMSWWRTFAAVAVAALHLDWEGTKQAWKDGVEDRVRIVADGVKRMNQIALEGREKMDAAANASLNIPTGTAAKGPKGGDKTMPIGKNTGDDPRLAAQLALQRAYQEAALRLQLEFLKEAGDQYDTAYAHGLLTLDGYYAARLAVQQQALRAELNARRQELADAQRAEEQAQGKAGAAVKSEDRRKHEAEVLKFKTEQVKLQGQINVLEAQSIDLVRRNAQEAADARQKADDQLTQIIIGRSKTRADFEVSTERTALEQMKALRMITAQDAFNFERQLEQKSYNAQLANIAARRNLIRGSQEEQKAQQAALDAEAEAAEQQHQARMTSIDNAAVLERKKYSLEAQQGIQDAFASMVSDLAKGQKGLLDVLKNFASQVTTIFTNLIAQNFAKRLFGAGTSGGGFIDKIVSFFMPSAAGGWDQVPADGTVTELHRNEMVLSAPIAETIRKLANLALPDSLGAAARMAGVPGAAPQLQMGSAGGGTSVTNNFTINGPTDNRTQLQIAQAAGRGVSQAMRRNG